jgi:hypothetical protein
LHRISARRTGRRETWPTGGFHQRWWANRLAAAKIEKLPYAFMAPDRNGNLEAFSLQVQAISYERNEEIVSSDSDRKATETRKEKPRPDVRDE